MSGNSERIDDLRRRKAKSQSGGGQNRVAAQHAKGKMTARERIEQLLDQGSFMEVDALVEKTSNVRVWVVAKKVYRIPGLSGVEDRLAPSADKLEANFKKFLAQGSGGSKNES